jgi:hypothetical protein
VSGCDPYAPRFGTPCECDCGDYYTDYDGYDADDEYPRETEDFDCD